MRNAKLNDPSHSFRNDLMLLFDARAEESTTD